MKAMKLALLLLTGISFCGCQDRGEQDRGEEAGGRERPQMEEGGNDMHTAKIALDYVGVYKGVLPTESGMEAEVTIELKDDGTYFYSVNYTGRENGSFETRGDYVWDDSGMVIELKSVDGSGLYFVAENLLVKLDENGDKVFSELSDNYVLEKQRDD